MKPKVILLVGASGSGKSWVANQIKDRYCYIPHDGFKKIVIELINQSIGCGYICLYDPTIGISTFIKRHSDKYDIDLVVIDEDIKVIEKRLISRGGKITPTLEKRVKRMKSLSKKAIFSGTSEECLRYLIKYVKGK